MKIDGRSVPLLMMIQRLHGSAFPPSLERAIDAIHALHAWRHGDRRTKLMAPAVCLAKLRRWRIRSDAALRSYLLNDARPRELRSLLHWSTRLRLEMAKAGADDPWYQDVRRRLGKRPTALRMLRVALSS